jgi:3-methyladenine DNA glycosylase AlkD
MPKVVIRSSSSSLKAIKRTLKQAANPGKARILQRFFKTGPGEYGEGDQFIGITVPILRSIARTYKDADHATILALLKSPIHEERLLALYLMIHQFKKGDERRRKQLYTTYIQNTRYINNWDLIDSSAEHIVGAYLNDKPKTLLTTFAQSPNLWKRRIAMIATYHYIKQGNATEALTIARILVNDTHDLIHKAVGWMLREIGQRCSLAQEETFLKQYAHQMPRTMLRYAIEKFPEKKRKQYMRYGTPSTTSSTHSPS